jgi:alpha-glucosidase
VIPDFTRPDVREWWGHLYATYTDTGVAGFVNDMNEPAMHERPIDEPDSPNKEPPPDTPFGARGAEEATHAEVRNVYASLENRATVEGLRRAAPGARPFVVTRAGFAGVQRDAIVWTGDNASVWEHLEMSLPQLLNLGLSGIPITGADVGGFFADCPPELLVRWAQLGAFYPFCRNNSAIRTTRQEPWTWGEPTTSRYRRAIELRYRLLPYLYTCIHEAAANGLPVLRPLFLDHADDKVAHDVADEAMVGRDLLIAPMLRPGKSFREVYLPGGGWYDLRSHEYLAGPNHVLASAGLDEDLPIFARAGSIIPMAPVMAWTEERPVDPLTLRVFLDDEGRAEGSLYEDDGVSLEYVDGLFSTTAFEARLIRPDVVAIARRRAGPFTPPRRRVEIVLVAPGSETRRTVDDGPEWEIGLERKVGGDR